MSDEQAASNEAERFWEAQYSGTYGTLGFNNVCITNGLYSFAKPAPGGFASNS